jgi:eukaryotic-like serine/threonine-protein kinase
MQNDSPETPKAVDEHIEEFLRRRHAGEVTSAEQYLREHPGLGPEFRDLLSALELLEQDKLTLLGRPQVRAESALSSAPLQVPNYEILGEIGRGGMGIVYRALHKTLNREVALKVLPKSGMENPQLLARFEQEARACAKLHHTNIVPIFEVGSADGVPFFAMQLIDGLGLDRVIETLSNGHRNRHGQRSFIGTQDVHDQVIAGFSTWDSEDFYRQVAKIGLQASEALTCAHQHGVIHRDIKPANLILDRNQNVWLTDFGLAKLNESDLTRTGDVFGTLRYLAPERLLGSAEPHSDQYSLGMTLYELAALHPVWEKGDRFSVLERIRQHQPKPLSALAPGLPRDLGTIISKAMSKNVTDRYASTAELSDDLRRYLDGRPIRARRLGPVEQLIRWGKRNPALAASFSLIVVLLTAGLVSTFVAMNHFRDQRDIQSQMVETTRQLLYNSEMMSGFDEVRSPTGVSRVHDVLRRWLPEPGETDLRGWEWYYLKNASGLDGKQQIVGQSWHGASLKPDQSQLAVFLSVVWILDRESNKQIVQLMSESDKIIIAAGWMNSSHFVVVTEPGVVVRFDSKTWTEIDRHSLDIHIQSAAIHPIESKVAITSTDSELFLIDFENTGTPRLEKASAKPDFRDAATDYSDDGKWLVAATTSDSVLEVRLLDATSLQEVARVGTSHEQPFKQIRFDAHSRRTVACGWDGRVSLIDWTNPTSPQYQELMHWPTAVLSATFVGDDSQIAFGGFDRVVHVWDIDSNKLNRDFKGHLGSVEALHSVNTQTLLSVARDGTFRTWALNDVPPFQQLRFASEHHNNWSVTWPSSDKIVTCAIPEIWERALFDLSTIRQLPCEMALWNEARREFVCQTEKELNWFQADGTLMRSATFGQILFCEFGGVELPVVVALVNGVDSTGIGIYVWDPKTDRAPEPLLATLPYCSMMKISRDGRWLAISSNEAVQLIHIPTRKVVQKFGYFGKTVCAAAWNADATLLALGSEEGVIQTYRRTESDQFELERVLPGNRLRVRDLAWHPFDDRLASVGEDQRLNLWNTNSGTLVINQEHESAVIDVSWSPNGESLATVTQWGELRIWNSGPRDE